MESHTFLHEWILFCDRKGCHKYDVISPCSLSTSDFSRSLEGSSGPHTAGCIPQPGVQFNLYSLMTHRVRLRKVG